MALHSRLPAGSPERRSLWAHLETIPEQISAPIFKLLAFHVLDRHVSPTVVASLQRLVLKMGGGWPRFGTQSVETVLHLALSLALPRSYLRMLTWYSKFSAFRSRPGHPKVAHPWGEVIALGHARHYLLRYAWRILCFPRQDTPKATRRYGYAKLPANSPLIRLLEYDTSRRLRFNILIVPFATAPEYTAISYMWGDSTISQDIEIDDGTGLSLLGVTKSAIECLMALQHSGRYVWIDAICINQSDMNEKTAQVGMMRDIYGAATRVIAILGDTAMATVNPNLNRCISGLIRRSLAYHSSMAEMMMREDQSNENYEASSFFTKMATSIDYPLQSGLLRLLCHPYWTRVWIIQELVVARSVFVYSDGLVQDLDSWLAAVARCPKYEESLVGPGQAPGRSNSPMYAEELCRDFFWMPKGLSNPPLAEDDIRALYRRGSERISSISSMRREYHSPETIRLGDIMLLSMHSAATQSRDKVFGIIGLMNTNVITAPTTTEPRPRFPKHIPMISEVLLVPNYDLSVSEAFADVSIALTLSRDEELIFYLGGVGWPRRQASLPSWAIDWTSPPPLYPRARSSIEHMCIYESHGYPESHGSARLVPWDRARLLATFDFVDEIIFVSEPIGPNMHAWFPEAWDTLSRVVGSIYEPPHSIWSCPIEEAVWRTLLGQRSVTKPRLHCYDHECHIEEEVIAMDLKPFAAPPSLRSLETSHTCREDVNRAFLAWSAACRAGIAVEDADALSERFARVLDHTRAIGCRFAITKTGYVGTVPPLTVVEDVITVHPKSRVPVVLRHAPGRHDIRTGSYKPVRAYQLVGSCYVLGLMSLEAFGFIDEPFPTEDVVLV